MDLEGVLAAQRREHGDEPFREHRLADPGRPGHQQVVRAGGRELERRACLRLAHDVGEVDPRGCVVRRREPPLGDRHRDALRGLAVPPDHLPERGGTVHRDGVDELGLGDVLVRDDDVPRTPPRGLEDRRQHPPHPAQPPVERQLAEVDHVLDGLPPHDPGGREDGDRDAEVEARPPLGDRRRREVDGDAVGWDGHAGVRRGRAHPVRRLAARGVREPTHREARQPLTDVGLDVDERAVQAGQGHRAGPPEPEGHEPTPTT